MSLPEIQYECSMEEINNQFSPNDSLEQGTIIYQNMPSTYSSENLSHSGNDKEGYNPDCNDNSNQNDNESDTGSYGSEKYRHESNSIIGEDKAFIKRNTLFMYIPPQHQNSESNTNNNCINEANQCNNTESETNDHKSTSTNKKSRKRKKSNSNSSSNKKCGRRSKKELNEIQDIENKYKSKMRSDNIRDKTFTHFFIFLFSFINLLLLKEGKHNRFVKPQRKEKKAIKVDDMINTKIEYVLKMINEKRKGMDERNYNAEVFEKVKELDSLKKIKDMNLKDFFKIYYCNSDMNSITREFGLEKVVNGNELKFMSDLTKNEYHKYSDMVKAVISANFLK